MFPREIKESIATWTVENRMVSVVATGKEMPRSRSECPAATDR